ncbi:sodium:potassium transporting atpase subunit [Trichuris trichiura]|uniref:Sodium/potassium-transporting ATPase subunit beta-1-interacting protein n=1 Tax=Trichuris trichiura TaxID=36087 RepID=A0A077Z785_TRITR|nr:sodium:potassium transporting atpase subunit [Trichuris trichiura]
MLFSRRVVLIAVVVNLALTVAREVFDFLSYLWFPIMVTFCNLLALVLALFGVAQSRSLLLAIVLFWIPLWILWNVFLTCFYLNVGGLDRDADLIWLNWSTSGRSWWYANAPECRVHYNQSLANLVVTNCLVPYYSIEVVIALVHCLSSFIVGFLIIMFLRRHDNGGSQRAMAFKNASVDCHAEPTVSVQLAMNSNPSSAEPWLQTSTDKTHGIANKSFEFDESFELNTVASRYYPVPNYRRSAEGSRLVKKNRSRFVDRLRQSNIPETPRSSSLHATEAPDAELLHSTRSFGPSDASSLVLNSSGTSSNMTDGCFLKNYDKTHTVLVQGNPLQTPCRNVVQANHSGSPTTSDHGHFDYASVYAVGAADFQDAQFIPKWRLAHPTSIYKAGGLQRGIPVVNPSHDDSSSSRPSAPTMASTDGIIV